MENKPKQQPHPRPAIDPDPKTHPLNPGIPAQTPETGADPKQPIHEGVK